MTYILYRDVPLFVLYLLPSSSICIFVFLIIPIVWIVRCTIKLCCKSYSMKYDQCVGKGFNMFGPRRAHAVARLSSEKYLQVEKKIVQTNLKLIFLYCHWHFYLSFSGFISIYKHLRIRCVLRVILLQCTWVKPRLFSKTTRIHINSFNTTVEQQARVICFEFFYTITLGLAKAGIVLLLSSMK